MAIKIKCIITVLCCILGIRGDNLELVMSNVAYRHGDRSPVATFPNDPHRGFWKDGLGQLTERGMSQEFAMGRFLRGRYVNKIINQTYSRNQVYCRSSDRDRTLMSAEAQMAGLFPPKNQKSLPSEKPYQHWQLIPIHVVPSDEDNLLRPINANCPKLYELVRKFAQSDEWRDLEEKNKEFLSNMSTAVGLKKPFTLAKIYQLNDWLFCQSAHNLSLPKWATSPVLAKLAKLSFFAVNGFYNSLEKRRLTGGILLKQMVNNMQKYVKNPKKSQKLFVYSTHDTTVMALLKALDFNQDKLPSYSAAFLIELYRDKTSKKYYVRMFYRNDTATNTPYELHLDECENLCALDSFAKALSRVMPDDYLTECGIKNDEKDKEPKSYEHLAKGLLAGLIVVVSILFITGVAVLLYYYYKRREKRGREQRQLYNLLTEEEPSAG